MNKKIKCPNCHLLFPAENKACPFCGEKVGKNAEIVEENAAKPSKKDEKSKVKKLELHVLFTIIACGLVGLNLLGMILPAVGETIQSMYAFAFNPTSDVTVGTNAAGIFMLFEAVALLNVLAVLWCLWKQTNEFRLFMYFTAFYLLVNTVVSFISPILCSSGQSADTFTFGIGFIICGVVSLAGAVMFVLALIYHKKYLVKKPSTL